MPVSLVTPSTRPATSSPNSSRTSSSDAVVSSTVSCSSAAHSVSVSSRMPAQMRATPTGWVMKSSPDWRRWSAWCSQANRNACSTCWRSTGAATSSACSETIANRSCSSSCSSGVRSSGIATLPSSPWSARSTGLCGAIATTDPSPFWVTGLAPSIEASSIRPPVASCSRWSEIVCRPQAVAGRPCRRPSARARCAAGSRPPARAGPSRSRLASPSSVRTRTRRPASAADLGCGPSPRSRCSTASPLLRPARAQGAVDGGQRVAEGEVPFVYS